MSREKGVLSASSSFSRERSTPDTFLTYSTRSKGLRTVFRYSAKTVNFRWKAATKSGFLKVWRSRLRKAALVPPRHTRETQSESDETASPNTPSQPNASEDLGELASLGAPIVMDGITANAAIGGWEPTQPPHLSSLTLLPESAQSPQPDSRVPSLPPSHHTSAMSEWQPGTSSATEINHPVIDLAEGRGMAMGNDDSGGSNVRDKNTDHPKVDTANEGKDPGPESSSNPNLVQIDVDYSSKSILDGGENVFFSTAHHEIVDPVMFKNARATLDRLQPDLEPIMGRLGRKSVKASSSAQISLVTIELRMSGEKEAGSTKITLQPSVWILCGTKATCKAIQRRLDQLTWLNSAYYSPIYIRNVLRLASSQLLSSSVRLDFNHGTPFWTETPNGRVETKVHVHVERSEMPINHGMLCCITITQGDDAKVLHQRLCRIGGYIIVDLPTGPQLVAVTTAHGLLEYWIQQDLGYETRISATEETEAMKLDDIDLEEETCLEEVGTEITTSNVDTEIDLVAEWIPAVFFPGNINFVSQASPASGSSFEVKTNRIDTDFLLLSIDNRVTGKAMEGANINSYIPDAAMSLNKTYGTIISIQPEALKVAEILPDAIPFSVNGVVFQTKKVELSEPACSGLSGTWVVQDHALCGVIIAIYEGEPFALMLTAEKLFSDIKRFSSNISSVKIASPMVVTGIEIDDPNTSQESVSDQNDTQVTAVQMIEFEEGSISGDFKPNTDVIGNTTSKFRSNGLYASGRFETRVSKFANQSTLWFLRGLRRLWGQKIDTNGEQFNEDHAPNSSSNDAMMVEPNTGGIDTVANRVSSVISESK
ncbi:hypothetical protein F4860DRAFT_401129 [Xylaria cubensis]|nr:hypothetical protein F4860DRAFT_401129 [Xylaria cubensis]